MKKIEMLVPDEAAGSIIGFVINIASEVHITSLEPQLPPKPRKIAQPVVVRTGLVGGKTIPEHIFEAIPGKRSDIRKQLISLGLRSNSVDTALTKLVMEKKITSVDGYIAKAVTDVS